jgi:hypothetical protein
VWVPVDHDNVPALATYRSTGPDAPEQVAVFNWTL